MDPMHAMTPGKEKIKDNKPVVLTEFSTLRVVAKPSHEGNYIDVIGLEERTRDMTGEESWSTIYTMYASCDNPTRSLALLAWEVLKLKGHVISK